MIHKVIVVVGLIASLIYYNQTARAWSQQTHIDITNGVVEISQLNYGLLSHLGFSTSVLTTSF